MATSRRGTYRFFSVALAVTAFAATVGFDALAVSAECGAAVLVRPDAKLITIGELDAGRLNDVVGITSRVTRFVARSLSRPSSRRLTKADAGATTVLVDEFDPGCFQGTADGQVIWRRHRALRDGNDFCVMQSRTA